MASMSYQQVGKVIQQQQNRFYIISSVLVVRLFSHDNTIEKNPVTEKPYDIWQQCNGHVERHRQV